MPTDFFERATDQTVARFDFVDLQILQSARIIGPIT